MPPLSGADSPAAFDAPNPEEGLGPAAFDDLAPGGGAGGRGNGRLLRLRAWAPASRSRALGDLFASVAQPERDGMALVAGGDTIERTVVGWLADALGCTGFAGTLTSGGSLANLMGLAMARESRAACQRGGGRRRRLRVERGAHVHAQGGRAARPRPCQPPHDPRRRRLRLRPRRRCAPRSRRTGPPAAGRSPSSPARGRSSPAPSTRSTEIVEVAPSQRPLAPRRRRVRRPGGARRAGAVRRPRRSRTRSRSTRTSGSTSHWTAACCSTATPRSRGRRSRSPATTPRR